MQVIKANKIVRYQFAKSCEKGFSLIEATVALLILLIVVLGVFSALAYAINYNTANNARSQALAVLQKEKEDMRSAKFSSSLIDTILIGGIKTPKTVITNDGSKFQVDITVDDNPFVDGIQIDNDQPLKEIELTVSPLSPTPGWQSSASASAVLRKVKAN